MLFVRRFLVSLIIGTVPEVYAAQSILILKML